MNPEIVGYIAAVLTTAAYIPQVLKVARHKHTQSISLGMYVLISGGVGSWFIFGVMINSPSVILANGISFFMIVYILFMKIKHG